MNRVYHYSTVDPVPAVAAQCSDCAAGGENSDTLGPQNGYGFESNHNFTENFAGFVFRGAPVPQLNYNFLTIRGGNVNYNPVPDALPSLLNQQVVRLLFTLQPIRPLTADNTYLLDRDFAVRMARLCTRARCSAPS